MCRLWLSPGLRIFSNLKVHGLEHGFLNDFPQASGTSTPWELVRNANS